MKRYLSFIAALAAVIVLTTSATDSYRDVLKADRYNAAGNYHPYPVPKYSDTKAPKGYTPFYVSHYGRHGSRYLIGSSRYTHTVDMMEQLHDKNLLTSEGEALRRDLAAMREAHAGQDGILTQVGSREHQGISSRLYKRVKKVFQQKNRRDVLVVSTPVHRVLQSAFNFVGTLKGNEPDLRFQLYSGDKYKDYLARSVPSSIKDPLDSICNAKMEAMLVELSSGIRIGNRLFRDTRKVQQELGEETLASFMYKLMEESSIARCLDIDVDPFSHFTDEELAVFGKIWNAQCAFWFHRTKETGDVNNTITGVPLLLDFIRKADEALKDGSTKCADLRFGHDSGIGPLLGTIGVEGYDTTPALADAWKEWPAYEYIPMGSNLQMIFYKNRQGDVLVKMLRNEKETTIPALAPFDGPYYKWEDLRAYLADICGLD
ncbi:MAG: histidine-type phosphatase [Bacteroidales bacterium]|nr:histidine-type phosphatase [Bacteroidales bacterium]MBO7584177.1 histidine-type phosphatase [Bacteroidales bacterium]MBP5316510.1 histidine-type phosphatase [Bacteroidales bacterium]